MDPNQQHIHKITDHLFRHESGRMVAVLTKIFGTENLETAEDVVQQTFINAIQVWRLKGIPANPSAWLFQVARNKAIDIIRRNKHSVQYDFSSNERILLTSEYSLAATMENLWKEELVKDDILRMMFACCHSEISEENQITLMLKTLCGFSTAEIAKAFLTSEDAISKRLYRTKEFFRDKKIKPEFPVATQLKGRTEAVLKTIYLIFNEGYNSSHSDELIRKDLLDQAMYLNTLLCNNPHTQIPEVYAAMALMCFHASRIDSRISPEGEIILLAQQDRSKWNRELIETANAYLNKAAFGDSLSSYHIEAAIAFEHCIAASFDKTNCPQILSYYDLLVQIIPSAIVALNRLTVVYKIKGAEETLMELDRSPYRKEWEKHYLYYSLLGEIFAQTNKENALENFGKAIALTHSQAEKKLLKKKMEQL